MLPGSLGSQDFLPFYSPPLPLTHICTWRALYARQMCVKCVLFPSHLTAKVARSPRAEFYSNCCPVRQRHSHRSPGDCYPPTTTSRSIITTSSTILISSTSPQRRFGRFSLPFLCSAFRRPSVALRGSMR